MKIKQIDINNSVIQNYWYVKYTSGIYHLLINTEHKWEQYHRYSNDEYCIGEDDHILDVPELKDLIPEYHLCVHMQEKDQISYYWIPFNLIETK